MSFFGRITEGLARTKQQIVERFDAIVRQADAPERRARAFSVFYTGTIGSGAVAPAIYGVVGDALGVSSALMVVAAIVLLTLPLSLVLKPMLATSPA